MTKRSLVLFSALALLVLVPVFAPATTINGIANQILSGLTQYGVVVGGGSNDLGVVSPSATSGYPLVSNGSSANPTFQTLPNAGLTNASVTVNTSSPLAGGGAVSLGGALTLTCTGCLAPSGVTNATAGPTPTWTIANGNASWTLTANASATVTVASGDQWKTTFMHVCQPSSGGPYTLTWPSNVKGGMTIAGTSNKCSDQVFESPDGTNLYAVSSGVIGQ